jgi:hypothetical protein
VDVDLRKVNCLNGDEGDLHFDALKYTSVSFTTAIVCAEGASVIHILDILLQLVRMGSGVQEHILDARISEELKRIFDQRGVRQRQKALSTFVSVHHFLLFLPATPNLSLALYPKNIPEAYQE